MDIDLIKYIHVGFTDTMTSCLVNDVKSSRLVTNIVCYISVILNDQKKSNCMNIGISHETESERD
jgi:hypothetical protein